MNTLVLIDIITHDLVSGEECFSVPLNTLNSKQFCPVYICDETPFRHAARYVKVMTAILIGRFPHRASFNWISSHCHKGHSNTIYAHKRIKCMSCSLIKKSLKMYFLIHLMINGVLQEHSCLLGVRNVLVVCSSDS